MASCKAFKVKDLVIHLTAGGKDTNCVWLTECHEQGSICENSCKAAETCVVTNDCVGSNKCIGGTVLLRKMLESFPNLREYLKENLPGAPAEPATLADAEAVEQHLEGALTEVRAKKERLKGA